MQHATHMLAKIAYLVKQPFSMFLACQPACHVRDTFRLVAYALQVGNCFYDGDDQAQIAGGRLPSRQHIGALLVNRDLHGIYLVIIFDNAGGQVHIAIYQGLHCPLKLLFDQAAHRQYAITYTLQLLVITPGDMFTYVQVFHQWPSLTVTTGNIVFCHFL